MAQKKEASNKMETLHQKVTLEKVGSHVSVYGDLTKRELRQLLLSSLSLLPTIDDQKVKETLMQHVGLTEEDLRNIREGGELSESAEKALKHLDITEDMISRISKSSKDAFTRDEKPTDLKSRGLRATTVATTEGKVKKDKLSPEEELLRFLQSKGLSEDLIKRLLVSGPTDELIRLLKALGFTDEDIEKLLKLQRDKLENQGFSSESEVSCISIPSSSAEYLSLDGLYLKNNLGQPLKDALQEVVTKKPFNPVEYLGHWLLHFKVCEERERRRKDFEEELLVERERMKKLETAEEEEEPEFLERGEEEQLENDWNFREYRGD